MFIVVSLEAFRMCYVVHASRASLYIESTDSRTHTVRGMFTCEVHMIIITLCAHVYLAIIFSQSHNKVHYGLFCADRCY